jgi:hypothetical protein
MEPLRKNFHKKILIVAINEEWVGISRLPGGLAMNGLDVHAICPAKSLLAKTRFLKSSIKYPTFTYSRSVVFYILALFGIFYFKPDVVLPGDEEALKVLQKLRKFAFAFELRRLFTLLDSSLPSSDVDDILLNKSSFIAEAKKWGVSVPLNIVISNLSELKAAGSQAGFPCVLKADNGYGGAGVIICQNYQELESAYLQRNQPSVMAKIKSVLKRFFFISLVDGKSSVSVQQFISGQVGIAAFLAKNGQVLAYNQMSKHRTYPGTTGPTSVAKSCSYQSVVNFVNLLAKATRFNHFGAIDFIIEQNTEKIYVIELNPRPTPNCHISKAMGANDLCEALACSLYDNAYSIVHEPSYLIAMYPNELRRDSQSEFVRIGYHDVPENDPDLKAALSQLIK